MSATPCWSLHPQLAADTHPVAALELGELLLMDDAQYPWLVLVPRVKGAVELVDLEPTVQQALLHEINRAAAALRSTVQPEKLNIAALGNVVPQLHVHVVARFHSDAAWPRPVWGAHPAQPYTAQAREALITRLRAALG
jgi:diadenosine tetraphosphate (Ap4A) HIT family hydrolase